MRSRHLVLILLALAVGLAAYLFVAGSATPVAPGGLSDLAEPDERPADPMQTDRVPRAGPPREQGSAELRAIDIAAEDATTGDPLTGFTFVLVGGGVERRPVVVAGDRQRLRLAPGEYALRASKPGWTPPAQATFRVGTGAAPPVTVRLRFSRPALRLELGVRDARTKAPLKGYQVTVRRFAPGATRPTTEYLPRQDEQPLTVAGADGQRIEVLVEAAGYRPAEPLVLTFDPATPVVQEQVFLVEQMQSTGIELRVTDPERRPVTRVGVLAHRLVTGAAPEFLWHRIAAVATGTYHLPDLGPGRYRFVVTGLDADDAPTLHLPHTEELDFQDGQHVIRPITLQPGAMLTVHVTDAQGRTIGAGVSIATVHPDGQQHEVLWQPLADGKPDRHARLGADKLVGDAPARLHRCLPPGRYTFRLRRGGGRVADRVVDLVAGRAAEVRVQLFD